MSLVTIVIAAAAGFATGAIWFGVFGRRWLEAIGQHRRPVRGARPFLIAATGCLATAGILGHVFAASGIATPGAGLTAGAGLGALAVAPWIVSGHAFAGRPRALWWIDGGHAVVTLAVIGTVLGIGG